MTDATMTSAIANEPKFTAEQIEENCPDRLQRLGNEIAVRIRKADKQIEQAENHSISIDRLIAQAQQLCDGGGFLAFQKKFFPDLGKSRVYELLAIGTNKKSVEETRARTRARVAKHRANKAMPSASVTVTENREPEVSRVPTENAAVQATSTAVEQTPEPIRSLGMPSHNVLLEITARVDDLIRKIRRREPGQFTGIGVEADGIVKLAVFLLDIANHKEPGIIKSMPIIARPDRGTGSAEQSAADAGTDADLDARVAALPEAVRI